MHIPVLQKEVLEYLDPKPNENFVDCTIGQAGHTLAVLEKTSPGGKVLGIDSDPQIYRKLKTKCLNSKFKQRIILVNDSYINLKKIVEKYNFDKVSGVLFDLGMSSWHLEKSGRGFSFLRAEPLDMRYDKNSKYKEQNAKLTAEKIINEFSEREIEKILREYGGERFARRIAKEITNSRRIKPIKTTFELVEIIKKGLPGWYQHQKIHFATKSFQALRIAVNDELNNLKKVLPQALEILKPGGRLAVISFHSLEDKIVKIFFREHALNLKILTKKPVRPSLEEIKINPRARSAKLRAAVKL